MEENIIILSQNISYDLQIVLPNVEVYQKSQECINKITVLWQTTLLNKEKTFQLNHDRELVTVLLT